MKDRQCQVCGKDLQEGQGYSKLKHEGETYYVCCPMCMAAFQKDPAKHIEPIPFMEDKDEAKGDGPVGLQVRLDARTAANRP